MLKEHKRINNLIKILSVLGAFISMLFLYFQASSNSLITRPPENSFVKSNAEGGWHELTIKNSVFRGVDKSLKPYKIVATKTSKISFNEYLLEHVKASYDLEKGKLFINASEGYMDDISHKLTLSNDVQVLLNDTVLKSQKLFIDLLTKQVKSDSKVTITDKGSEIKADSFASDESSSVLTLKGHVKTKIKVSDDK